MKWIDLNMPWHYWIPGEPIHLPFLGVLTWCGDILNGTRAINGSHYVTQSRQQSQHWWQPCSNLATGPNFYINKHIFMYRDSLYKDKTVMRPFYLYNCKSILVRQHLYIEETPGHLDGLMQERRNSIANTLELWLSCTNASICYHHDSIAHLTCISTAWR